MADTVIPPFLNRLGHMLLAEVDSLDKVEDQLWLLYSTLTRLTPFLTEVAIVENDDEDLKEEASKKAMEVITLVHEAETITDTYLYTVREGNFSGSSMDVGKFQSEIKEMIEKLKGLYEWFFGFKESSTTSVTSSSSSSSKRPSPSSSAIEDGRDDDDDDGVIVQEDEVTRLMDMLVKDEDHAGRRDVIPVVGPRGLGKTTFVRKVYNHPIIVEHFPCRSWIYVSNDYKVEELLQDILKQIIKDKPTTAGTEAEMRREMKKNLIKELAMETYKRLKTCSTRYLVVFDDVCDVNFWADIEMIFPAKNKSGSRVILITRHDEVASLARPNRPPFYLRRLSKEESWALFSKRISLSHVELMNCLGPEWVKWFGDKDVGVDGCVGLPPAIIELAAGLHRFLHSPPSHINPEKIRELASGQDAGVDGRFGLLAAIFKLEEEQNQILQGELLGFKKNRELIYSGVPSHLGRCLGYYIGHLHETGWEKATCSYFDYKGLIVAEGLVKSPPPPQSLIQSRDHTTSSSAAATAQVVEDIADEYLNELIKMNLIEVQRKSFDGRIKEIAIPNKYGYLSDTLRFEVAVFSKIKRSAAATATSKKMSSEMRDLFMPSKITCRPDLSHRVLDLKIEGSPHFPSDSIINLIHLRYLRLEYEYYEFGISRAGPQDIRLEHLSALCNLQFLKIKLIRWGGEPLSYNLRLQFWKMRQLRHLSCSLKDKTTSTYLILDPQLVLNSTNNGDHGSIPVLNNLQTLESLDTQFYMEGSTEDSVWSSMIPNLVTLRVQGDIQDRITRGFPLLDRLRKLKLVGEYKSSSSSSSSSSNNLEIFPPNITHLSLQDTQFHGTYLMQSLRKLQNLRSLKLKRRCINTDESKVLDFGGSNVDDDGFCQLKFLKLKETDIKKWKMSEEVMPSLQKVAVSSCQELEGLPVEALKAIPTLQELEVDGKTSDGVSTDATLLKDHLKLRTG